VKKLLDEVMHAAKAGEKKFAAAEAKKEKAAAAAAKKKPSAKSKAVSSKRPGATWVLARFMPQSAPELATKHSLTLANAILLRGMLDDGVVTAVSLC